MRWQDVEGWFDEANAEAFRKFQLPANSLIVEAGTYKGRSATFFAETWPDATIVTCDPTERPQGLPDNVLFVPSRADLVDADAFEKGIDLLFIDDSHLYNDTKASYEHLEPFVKKGGIIAFHDISFPHSEVDGVRQFVDELRRLHGDIQVDTNGEYGLAWRVK